MNKDDKFRDIKEKIARFFLLPPEDVFLKNDQDQILLDKDRVMDEIFPLQSARINGQVPQLFMTFAKDMDTKTYILGDLQADMLKDNLAKMQ